MTRFAHLAGMIAVLVYLTEAGPGWVGASSRELVPAATKDPQAVALLEQMRAAQRAFSSYAATLERTTDDPQSPETTVYQIAFRQPNRVAVVKTAGAGGQNRVVADGRNLYIVSPGDSKHYRRGRLPARIGLVMALHDGVGKLVGALLLGGETAKPTTVALGPDGEVAGVPVQTVETTVPSRQRELRCSFAVGRQDHLLRRIRMSLTVDGQAATATWTFSNVQANPSLPDARFAFTPPPGAKPISLAPARPHP